MLPILAVALAITFIIIAATAPAFLQDDAYISFRYARNFLGGDGLVFNPGERVEGYTNFLWVMILALAVKLGFAIAGAARWLGILFSAGSVVATIFLARRALAAIPARWSTVGAVGAGLWVAVNPALCYWAIAGLETGLLVFLLTWGIERRLAGSRLCWIALALATLTRPEGALVFAIAYGWHLLRKPNEIRRNWSAPLAYFALPLLPFAAFKLWYYGPLFPNPFYAKTGFSPEYWASGIDYLWLHLQHVGLWGALLVPVAFVVVRSGWRSGSGLVAILWALYTMYVVAIGGDVLRAHRFFVPVWPMFAVAAGGGLTLLGQLISRRTLGLAIAAVALAGIAGYQLLYPAEYFSFSRRLEAALVEKMRTVAESLAKTDPREFSIAASTIGRLSYDLPRHPVIDMLGLTDSAVARHPETIPGMQTTWKERHFNAAYILARNPDYILFSTGYKPSAPAERALLLHAGFRRNYTVMLYPAPHLGRNLAVYKRVGDFAAPDSVWPDLQLANDYNDALNLMIAGDMQKAIGVLSRMKRTGPGDFDAPDCQMSVALTRLGRLAEALAHADSALAINQYSITALTTKHDIYAKQGDTANVTVMRQTISRLSPWLLAP